MWPSPTWGLPGAWPSVPKEEDISDRRSAYLLQFFKCRGKLRQGEILFRVYSIKAIILVLVKLPLEL